MSEIYDHRNNPFEPLDPKYVLDQISAEFLIGNLTVSGFYMREYEQLREQAEMAEVIPLRTTAIIPAPEPKPMPLPAPIRRFHASELIRGPRDRTVGIASGFLTVAVARCLDGRPGEA